MPRFLAVALAVGALLSAGAVASLGLLNTDGLPIEWAGAGSPLPADETPSSVSIADARAVQPR